MPKPRIVLLPASKMPKNAVKLTHNILELLRAKDPVIDKIISNAQHEIDIFRYTRDFIKEFKQFARVEDVKTVLKFAKEHNRIIKTPTKNGRIFYYKHDEPGSGFYIDPRLARKIGIK